MNGRQVGHFEITSKLGEGGMGVVYECVDQHLNRRVALKVLPADKVANPTRRMRFVQEARAASALNHPNIVTIYEINSADGVDYIAMELVPGRTLLEIMARRRLRLQEMLKYAVQMADALAAAHAAGIVHRDLKPANVMVTDSGLVKVLDFGLAKLTDWSEAPEEDRTLTRDALTAEGTVVGTAAYMSPEQADGRKVDARSDIFAFGVVLYEMLSGKRAFHGDTRLATIAAVLRDEPAPLGEVAPGVPRELERIVMRCLRKDLARRSQSMAEIKIALEELKEETESGQSVGSGAVAKGGGGRSRRGVTLGGAVLVLGAALALGLPRWGEKRTPPVEVPLTSYPGYQGEPSLSPDGSQFAFVWDGGQEGALPQVYVSLAGKGTPLRLTQPADGEARYPAWSPDGQWIAFVRYQAGKATGDLVLIPALGGPERKADEGVPRVAPGTSSSLRMGPAWSPDGRWLYFTAGTSAATYAVFVEPASGGERRRLIEPQAGSYGDRSPAVSPDGKRLVFVRALADHHEDLFMADLRGGNAAEGVRRLTSDYRNTYSPWWSVDGKDVIYIAGEWSSRLGIYRVRASGGAPSRVEGISSEYASALAIAPRGGRMIYSRALRDYNLWRMALGVGGESAGTAVKLLSSTRFEVSPAYSPDGRRVAFSSNRSGVRQIWVADADGSGAVALTNFSEGVAGSPRWSPDGRTIVFDARPQGMADVYSIAAEGGAPKRLTNHPPENHVPCYSVDGRWIYFASTRSGVRQIYRMPAQGGEAVQITRQGAYVPMPSPDGKWIYYSKEEGGIWRVAVEGGEEVPVVEARATYSGFLFGVTASGIYYAGALDPVSRTAPLKMYRLADGKTVELGHFDKPLGLFFSVSPDEKWLLYSQMDSSVDDLMLVENFQ